MWPVQTKFILTKSGGSHFFYLSTNIFDNFIKIQKSLSVVKSWKAIKAQLQKLKEHLDLEIYSVWKLWIHVKNWYQFEFDLIKINSYWGGINIRCLKKFDPLKTGFFEAINLLFYKKGSKNYMHYVAHKIIFIFSNTLKCVLYNDIKVFKIGGVPFF